MSAETMSGAASGIGRRAAEFRVPCVQPGSGRWEATLSDYTGRWLILIFYPRDFSFVCPTELTSFSARAPEFTALNCALLGISVDSVESHEEWLQTSPDEGGLGPLQFPLASDAGGDVSREFGVWIPEKEVCTRGLFIIDPEGVLQYAVHHSLSVGRNPKEVLRVLQALQTGGLCAASWTTADGTIDVEHVLQPGKVLGHYRVQETLGSGTFGTVFAATDLRLERKVALKVLNQGVVESGEELLSEARIAARLNHINVCTVYAIEEEDGLPLIAMEYLDGAPLSELPTGGFSRRQALRIALGLAEGLGCAHQQSIVHGDLKPANMILTTDGTVKILDFGLARSQRTSASPRAAAGLARAARAAAAKASTDATVVVGSSVRGTPAYMAPELVAGTGATMASDIFALALVIIEVLTGRRALSERALPALLSRIADPNLAEKVTQDLEPDERNLIRTMLARDPEERPAIEAVIPGLRELLDRAESTKRADG